MKKIKWGVVAPGHISQKFSEALGGVECAVRQAVASRDGKRAAEYARKWGFIQSYGSYEQLFADPEVDAVYVASPNMNHHVLSIQALRAGKHVVCEKPATLNAAMLQSVLAESKSRGLFFMEALWMKFLPAFLYAIDAVKTGKIGALQMIKADFFINRPYAPNDRRYELSLGGGALIDIGIYPAALALSAAAAFFGGTGTALTTAKPVEARGFARITGDGIDVGEDIIMHFAGNGQKTSAHESASVLAQISCALDNEGVGGMRDGWFIGSKGKIRLPLFPAINMLELYDVNTVLTEKKEFPFRVNGFEHQIEEACRCINEGKTESPLHSHADTLLLIETLDGLRSQWNLVYPQEAAWH